MVHLTLAGVSGDGTRLLLVSDSGEEHTLAIDAPLRAALRGEPLRLGQLELDMESTLRPREIQNRIRAGATPEAVADAAHTTVEKILPFANPVLAERAHVAQRAQRASVRRTAGEPGAARTLGDAVAAALRPLNVDPDGVEWDAWRREDGRWVLVARHEHEGRAREAHYTFDAPGNYVTVDDADAAWLVGDAPAEPPVSPTGGATGGRGQGGEGGDDLQRARRRRLSAVGEQPADQLTIDAELGGESGSALGEDAIELVTEPEPEGGPAGESAAGSAGESAAGSAGESVATSDPAPDETSTADLTATAEAVRARETGDRGEPDGASEETPAAPRRPRRKGRASVPSWDEIMFGSGERD